ncbi:hypothetical protein [Streptomyces mirabilis]|uniref:hypothetical protein n=1 Tax=Streptomyces mirabilis TaxID=68239 RepID=UPI00366362EC
MASDPFEALAELVRQRQRERGFPNEFKIGDLVRFPLGEPYNRERDYRIKTIYNNGFEVECDGFVYAHTDEAAIRLGMTHSPNHGARS